MNNHERQKALTSSPAKSPIRAIQRCVWQCSQHLILGNNSQLAYDSLRLLGLWSSTRFSAWIVLFPVSFYVESEYLLRLGNAKNPVLGKRCRIIKPKCTWQTTKFPFLLNSVLMSQEILLSSYQRCPPIHFWITNWASFSDWSTFTCCIFLSYHVQAHILSALNARRREPLICKKFLLKCAQTHTKAQAIYTNQLNGTPCP